MKRFEEEDQEEIWRLRDMLDEVDDWLLERLKHEIPTDMDDLKGHLEMEIKKYLKKQPTK